MFFCCCHNRQPTVFFRCSLDRDIITCNVYCYFVKYLNRVSSLILLLLLSLALNRTLATVRFAERVYCYHSLTYLLSIYLVVSPFRVFFVLRRCKARAYGHQVLSCVLFFAELISSYINRILWCCAEVFLGLSPGVMVAYHRAAVSCSIPTGCCCCYCMVVAVTIYR